MCHVISDIKAYAQSTVFKRFRLILGECCCACWRQTCVLSLLSTVRLVLVVNFVYTYIIAGPPQIKKIVESREILTLSHYVFT